MPTSTELPSAANTSHTGDERWELVQRMAVSVHFRRSPRLREFLLFVCDREIANARDDLKEQRIGHQVFGRRFDYNPSEDNIVRVEARQLRKRIEEYFAEAPDEKLILTVPKGSYVPYFEPRKAPVTAAIDITEAPTMPLPVARKSYVALTWQLVSALLACICVGLWLGRAPAKSSQSAGRNGVQQSSLWPMLFNKDQDTSVVCADSALVVFEDMGKRQVGLPEYTDGSFAEPDPKRPEDINRLGRLIAHRQYTSIADLRMIESLMLRNSDTWSRTSIQSARNLHSVDFKRGNFIMLGSSRGNPWIDLFQPQLNFVWQFDEALGQGVLRNRSPRPGEQRAYVGEPGATSYAVIDFLPNLAHTGRVLIVGGATMEGTEGASELVMNPSFVQEVLKPRGAVQNGKPLYFELLLRTGTLGGTSETSEVVAFRRLPGG